MCNSQALQNPFKSTFGGSPRDHLKRAINQVSPPGIPNPSHHLDKQKPRAPKRDKTWGPYGPYVNAFDARTKTLLGG